MGKYDCVYELDITSYERDMEKQGGRENDDKNCDVDIRGELEPVIEESSVSRHPTTNVLLKFTIYIIIYGNGQS
ncbi:hypothetical protein RDI58_026301 [Solanum bulbocastanum]|uniref:Uncharacterized protein n=1 Tax=Solanum bulbocastanum TaxID=147425 RepID=A0AAN8Y0Q8_SOLBU